MQTIGVFLWLLLAPLLAAQSAEKQASAGRETSAQTAPPQAKPAPTATPSSPTPSSATPSSAAVPSSAMVEQLIITNEQLLEDGWLRHNKAVVGRFYADDFRGVTHSGHVIGKAEILKAVDLNDETATEAYERNVRVLGDSAIYCALITDRGALADGTKYTVRTRVMDIWARRDGAWVMVASQETAVGD